MRRPGVRTAAQDDQGDAGLISSAARLAMVSLKCLIGRGLPALCNWLATSQWGRCVYQCDNTAVDYQVVAMRFNGGTTATFTMSAFATGQNIEL